MMGLTLLIVESNSRTSKSFRQNSLESGLTFNIRKESKKIRLKTKLLNLALEYRKVIVEFSLAFN